MRCSYCIWALAALLIAPLTAQAPQGSTAMHAYVIFLRGTAIGREEVTVTVGRDGTTISSRGRTAVPLETVLQRVELRYNAQGSPESFLLDGLIDGTPSTVRTSIKDGSATTTTFVQGRNTSTTQRISPDALVLSSGVFGSFAAMVPKLAARTEGAEYHLFLVPSTEISARLLAIRTEQMQTGATIFDVRRYDLAIGNSATPTILSLTTAPDGSLIRIAIPAQSLDVLREDIAGSNTRTAVHTNPGDHQVQIPALGFTLGATLTVPAGMAPEPTAAPKAAVPLSGSTGPGTRTAPVARTRPVPGTEPEPASPARRPAVVLVSGRGSPDRDAVSLGAPAMAELAGALAEAGFVTVRYDNRGVGQSGGRTESATLDDYAGDVRAAVKWLAERKDIDGKRIAIVAHGEGAWMAMLTASLDRRVAAVVTLAAPASKGEQLILEQQRTELEALSISDADRAAKEALQKQVHAAVLTGKGWDKLPANLRRRADTPWFRSVLEYDPAKVIGGIRAPILIVHGDLDREITVDHAERLAELARKGKSESVELALVRGVNHQLTTALTGSVREYPMLSDHGLSPDVSSTVTSWLARTLPAPREH
jgi:uncharacterized protein